MSEQAGFSVAAVRARQAALAGQHSAAADADDVLADALASAHAVLRDGIRRLDTIAAEIDRAVADQAALAIDTPLGAREFQSFLVGKEREIATIVADAHELDRAKSALLEALRARYAGPAG
ncbi:DUF4226 domain-containing protein [Mycobacterium decipiens]|uniref:DUF4226 domain-containing protein n=1 Tax=Mycobacterium decipiens TaxID=1430326 RepID=A0A1X2LU33_9MYCO|nr:DUF4226 domain-containing protein [Mycobacterium decipiens]OSC40358.1 hypothetical protein B8W66_13270 [Mycobacterium decipiens]